MKAKQCAVLFVDTKPERSNYPAALRSAGFLVRELSRWPDEDATLREYHVLMVRVRDASLAPMMAARLRAKPHCDRRVLIAIIDGNTSTPHRRSAEAGGFDAAVEDGIDARHLMACVLKELRARPALRCLLPLVPRRTAA